MSLSTEKPSHKHMITPARQMHVRHGPRGIVHHRNDCSYLRSPNPNLADSPAALTAHAQGRAAHVVRKPCVAPQTQTLLTTL